MHFQKFTDRCIICLKQPPFAEGNDWSNEHLIPEALGGKLTCEFVCKFCNSKMGGGFERSAKTDPSIRIAIGNLSNELPDLYAAIEEGQEHIVNTNIGTVIGKYRGGEIQGGALKLQDGSLLVPTNTAKNHLKNILRKDGLTEIEIQNALEIYNNSNTGQRLSLSPVTSVIQHVSVYGGISLNNGETLSPLVFLKIAYEYAVLIAGSSILEPVPALQAIRNCLAQQCVSPEDFCCESLNADKYEPFHGIAFEGNNPSATFQIRLFGKLAYRIKLLKLAINTDHIIYTHNLKTGEEHIEQSKPSRTDSRLLNQ